MQIHEQLRDPTRWTKPSQIVQRLHSWDIDPWTVQRARILDRNPRQLKYITGCSLWTVACQTSLFIANSRSLLKLMSIESVMPSNHLILCHPLLLSSIFPSIRVFSNESVLRITGQSIGVSVSASVLPMNIQDWYPLGLTGWISLQSKGLNRSKSRDTG